MLARRARRRCEQMVYVESSGPELRNRCGRPGLPSLFYRCRRQQYRPVDIHDRAEEKASLDCADERRRTLCFEATADTKGGKAVVGHHDRRAGFRPILHYSQAGSLDFRNVAV